MAFSLPPLPQQEPTWPQMQAWWQQVIEAIVTNENAQTDLIQQILDAQATADEALAEGRAIMPDLSAVTVSADYTGAVNPGQLPRSVQASRFDGSTDVTASSAWSMTASAGITASVNPTTGLVTFTDVDASGTYTVTSVHNSISRSRTAAVTLQSASAPSTGSSGGTSATDTSFTAFSAATHSVVSDELTVTVGTSGNVQLSAPLAVYTAEAPPTGTFEVFGVWQWYDTGTTTWVDVGTEVASNPDATYFGGMMSEGTLNVSVLKSGLAASSSQKFRLMARTTTGSRLMYLEGEASAVAV